MVGGILLLIEVPRFCCDSFIQSRRRSCQHGAILRLLKKTLRNESSTLSTICQRFKTETAVRLGFQQDLNGAAVDHGEAQRVSLLHVTLAQHLPGTAEGGPRPRPELLRKPIHREKPFGFPVNLTQDREPSKTTNPPQSKV